jgi:hypothetical protein
VPGYDPRLPAAGLGLGGIGVQFAGGSALHNCSNNNSSNSAARITAGTTDSDFIGTPFCVAAGLLPAPPMLDTSDTTLTTLGNVRGLVIVQESKKNIEVIAQAAAKEGGTPMNPGYRFNVGFLPDGRRVKHHPTDKLGWKVSAYEMHSASRSELCLLADCSRKNRTKTPRSTPVRPLLPFKT